MIRLVFHLDEEKLGKFNEPQYLSEETCARLRANKEEALPPFYSKEEPREITTRDLSDRDLVLFILDPDSEVGQFLRLVSVTREDGRSVATKTIERTLADLEEVE